MGKNLAGKTDGNALGAVRENERELGGKRNRFLVPSIVAGSPGRCLRIEEHFVGELGKSCLDVSRSRRGVTGEDISPVSLGVDDEFLLAHIDEGISDRLVPVRVILHRVTDDVGDLVEASIVFLLQRMQDATLNGFQTIIDMRDCPLENDIAGIVEKPVGIHSLEGILGGFWHEKFLFFFLLLFLFRSILF